jgi:hypothetical protein
LRFACTLLLLLLLLQEAVQRKKCFGCGSCLCVVAALLTILALFFLLPRTPTMWLAQVTANPTSGALEGAFEFVNNNYFSVTWENPDVDLYWLPYDQQLVTQSCFGVGGTANDSCAFYRDGWCAIKVAEFSETDTFTTKKRTSVERDLGLTQTSQALACSLNMLASQLLNGQQRMLTTGSVHASSPLRNFGRVAVSEVYYYFAN